MLGQGIWVLPGACGLGCMWVLEGLSAVGPACLRSPWNGMAAGSLGWGSSAGPGKLKSGFLTMLVCSPTLGPGGDRVGAGEHKGLRTGEGVLGPTGPV